MTVATAVAGAVGKRRRTQRIRRHKVRTRISAERGRCRRRRVRHRVRVNAFTGCAAQIEVVVVARVATVCAGNECRGSAAAGVHIATRICTAVTVAIIAAAAACGV